MLTLVANGARRTQVLPRAARWLRSLRTDDPGAFCFAPQTAPGLLGSACAALSAELVDPSLLESPGREAWIRYLGTFQRDDGWFDDPTLEADEATDHTYLYLLGHQTFLATMALDALGTAPPRPLAFLDRWRDDEAVYDWIDSLSWTDPWSDSNWVEWIGCFLLADAGLRPQDVPLPPERWPAGFGGLMRWLTSHVDPQTGFWGKPALAEPWCTMYRVAAAYHHYVFFYATGTAIPSIEHVIDATLSLQQPGGLFRPNAEGGGPCDDLNAIDILANMTRLSAHRRGDVLDALERASHALCANQRRGGAFVWSRESSEVPDAWQAARKIVSIDPRVSARERRRALHDLRHRRLGPRLRYSSCPGLRFHKAGGDLFSHWFRPLALAVAAQVLPPDRRVVNGPFRFRNQITQGWWPGGAP